MDKIKLTQITHLMARIRSLMDDDNVISARIYNKLCGDADLHLYEPLFRELFDEYKKNTRFDDTMDELSTEINGIKVFCLVDKDDRTTD